MQVYVNISPFKKTFVEYNNLHMGREKIFKIKERSIPVTHHLQKHQ